MKESDWKIFKKIKEKAIEKYCTLMLGEFQEVIADESEHVHDRYLLLYKLVHSRNKRMSQIFDGHSRSKASMQLIFMRMEGLTDQSLVEKLSEEFQEGTNPARFE